MESTFQETDNNHSYSDKVKPSPLTYTCDNTPVPTNQLKPLKLNVDLTHEALFVPQTVTQDGLMVNPTPKRTLLTQKHRD